MPLSKFLQDALILLQLPIQHPHGQEYDEPMNCSTSCILKKTEFVRRNGLTHITSSSKHIVVVSTHSLDPCLWGESNHPTFGPPASLSLHLASSSITLSGSVHKSRGDSVFRMWVKLKRWCVSCVWVLHRGHSGDECDFVSTLCKYDLTKGYLFVLSWAWVRRVRSRSLSSELIMCGGGVRSILLLRMFLCLL